MANPLKNNTGQIQKPKKKKGFDIVEIDGGFPEKLLPLYTDPWPINVTYGGRASGKSTAVARTLLLMGKQYPMRILCCREFATISDKSMHQTLIDEIYALGLQDFYEYNKDSIVGKVIDPNSYQGYPIRQTEFIYRGISNNPQGIKSMQKVSACWIEEAQNLTEFAWENLEATVRQELPNGLDPPIFIVFNPQYADNFVWEHFVLRPQEASRVIECNYLDNPWCPKASKRQANAMKKANYAKYENIWLGKPLNNFVGSVYEDYLEDAYRQNRVRTEFEDDNRLYDPNYAVELYFDLGASDMTAVWAAQRCDGSVRLIDYYENRRKPASHYIEIMSNRGYPVKKWVLPWDSNQKAGPIQLSWEDVFRKAGLSVRKLRYKAVMDGINAARELFSTMIFDGDKCAQGLNALRHYRFAEFKDKHSDRVSSKPVHDIYSNGADAFRYCAMGIKHRELKPFPKFQDNLGHLRGNSDSWMAAL